MLMNLTDVLTSEEKVVTEQVETGLTELACRAGKIPVTEKTPLTLVRTSLGKNKALLEGRMEITLSMRCDRCLRPVEQKLALDFKRTVSGPDAVRESGTACGPDAGQEDTEDDGQDFMEGYQLNINDLVSNECFLNLPVKVLCRSDCKGLCPKCGKDLNAGECGCDTFVPDPRMAGIKEIFESYKEV